MPIRCFFYRKGAYYYAECLDLNLLTRADTRDEAIGSLQEAMFGYIETVFDGGPKKGLLPRRAPLSSWIRYYLHRLSDMFRRHKGHSSEACSFEVVVPFHS